MYYYKLRPTQTTQYFEQETLITKEVYEYELNVDGEKPVTLYVGESVIKKDMSKRFQNEMIKRINRHINNTQSESVRYSKSGQDSMNKCDTPHSQYHNSI